MRHARQCFAALWRWCTVHRMARRAVVTTAAASKRAVFRALRAAVVNRQRLHSEGDTLNSKVRRRRTRDAFAVWRARLMPADVRSSGADALAHAVLARRRAGSGLARWCAAAERQQQITQRRQQLVVMAAVHVVSAALRRWRSSVRRASSVERPAISKGGFAEGRRRGDRRTERPPRATISAISASGARDGMLRLALALRVRSLVQRWWSKARRVRAHAKRAAAAMSQGRATWLCASFDRWYEVISTRCGASLQRASASAARARRLRMHAWCRWLCAAALGRNRSMRTRADSLRRARLLFDSWSRFHQMARRVEHGQRIGEERAARGGLMRGVAALRRDAIGAMTRRLAVAATKRCSRRHQRRRAAAALVRWAVVCSSETRRRAAGISIELQLRSELLAQARAASAAVEAENENLRERATSLDADVSGLQEVLLQQRTESDATSDALATLEARLEESETAQVDERARLAAALDDADDAKGQLAQAHHELIELREANELAMHQVRDLPTSHHISPHLITSPSLYVLLSPGHHLRVAHAPGGPAHE